MKHRMFLTALGLLAAAFAGTEAHATANDPTGIWLNDTGLGKIEVKKCGKNLLCAKIVWLKEPIDSRGKPLHDTRNEDPSMHDRPILGMPLFANMTPQGPGVWVGSVYNPEEGHVFTDVKVTLASSRQIVLRGCKAWLLCGEKSWTKSTLEPKPEPEAEPQQIEAKATPTPDSPSMQADANPVATAPATPAAAIAAKPAKVEVQASVAGGPEIADALPNTRAAKPQALSPELPSGQDASAGYGFTTTSATPQPVPPFSSQNVSSMFAMTPPETDAPTLEDEAAADVQEPTGAAVPLPEPKPKAMPKAQASVDADSTPSVPVEPVASAPKPKPEAETKPQVSAEADAGDTVPVAPIPKPKAKTVVKKDREELPWLQHP
jgi:uncharacterized protein (DUF2147 family)